MPSLGTLDYSIRVQDATAFTLDRRKTMRFNPLAPNGVLAKVTLTGSAFTALPVPTGAQFLILFLGAAGAVNLTLKGVTGDTGIPMLPAASPAGFDLMIPLTTTTIGIFNAGVTQTIEMVCV